MKSRKIIIKTYTEEGEEIPVTELTPTDVEGMQDQVRGMMRVAIHLSKNRGFGERVVEKPTQELDNPFRVDL